MAERFEDTGESIHAFMEETLVVCPKCAGCAVSRQSATTDRPGWFAPRRLTCGCSYSKEWRERTIARGWSSACDDYFGLPLWLQTPCCSAALWAYNERHLVFLEGFVGADLRERSRDETRGWSNGSLASRLPTWVKAAKNRQAVLQGLLRLRQRLVEAGQ